MKPVTEFMVMFLLFQDSISMLSSFASTATLNEASDTVSLYSFPLTEHMEWNGKRSDTEHI